MFDGLGRGLLFLVMGMVTGAVATEFASQLLRSNRHKVRYAELERERDEAMLEMLSRKDMTDYDRARTEVSIARDYARALDNLDAAVSRTNILLRIFAAVGGLVGLIAVILHYFDDLESLVRRVGSVSLLTTPAAAADAAKSELAPLLPYIALAVLSLMAISFLGALITLLIVKDTKENQAKIKTADNIVKTFGGFFTGLATTLLH